MTQYNQTEFDYLVNELIQQGNTLADSVKEIVESFEESNFDVKNSLIFVYTSNAELELKVNIQNKCKVIESNVKDSFNNMVNVCFVIQGLEQIIKREKDERLLKNVYHIFESRKVFQSILKTICFAFPEQNEDDEKLNANGEEDDDEGATDTEKNRTYQRQLLLNFVLLLLEKHEYFYRNSKEMMTIDSNTVDMVCKALDDEMYDSHVTFLILQLIGNISVNNEENKSLFLSHGIVNLLQLASKVVNKKNLEVHNLIEKLIQLFH